MRRTEQQIKQQIKEALLEGEEVINKNAIIKKKGICYRTVCKYLPEIYRKLIKKEKK